MSEDQKLPSIDIDLISADGIFIFGAAALSLIETLVKATPPAQNKRNHARAERILTFIEEEICKFPPLEEP